METQCFPSRLVCSSILGWATKINKFNFLSLLFHSIYSLFTAFLIVFLFFFFFTYKHTMHEMSTDVYSERSFDMEQSSRKMFDTNREQKTEVRFNVSVYF